MADIFLLIPLLASLLVVFLLMPFWIRKAHQIGLIWDDMNKVKAPKVAGSGGIIAVLAFILGILILVAYRVFVLHSFDHIIETFALLTVVLLASGIGLVDDLFGWQRGGLSKRSRMVLLIFAAIPLMVINVGRATINLPFIGEASLGIIYPLILIPIGVVGATTTFNFLAGFNGLEAGQGALLLGALSLVAFLTGTSWLAIIGLCMVAALVAFLFYNVVPARVFPGDVLTYAIGSLIAIMPIIGNFERIAVFFFIPYILETILKARGGLVKQSFGLPQRDGSLKMRYDKVYGLEHFSIFLFQKLGVRATEQRVVYSIWLFQFIIILVGMLLFRHSLFL
jgi:UDP-N-acetylglucosamine--dolichyl-phosphate N-acetylglucosaminephosphotransferase